MKISKNCLKFLIISKSSLNFLKICKTLESLNFLKSCAMFLNIFKRRPVYLDFTVLMKQIFHFHHFFKSPNSRSHFQGGFTGSPFLLIFGNLFKGMKITNSCQKFLRSSRSCLKFLKISISSIKLLR